MRVKIEIDEKTNIFVHDLKPQIKILNAASSYPLYVLCDQADFKTGNVPASVSVFLDRQPLRALYEQLKEILEPESEAACDQPASV